MIILKNTLKPLGEEFLVSDESDQWIVSDLGDYFNSYYDS